MSLIALQRIIEVYDDFIPVLPSPGYLAPLGKEAPWLKQQKYHPKNDNDIAVRTYPLLKANKVRHIIAHPKEDFLFTTKTQESWMDYSAWSLFGRYEEDEEPNAENEGPSNFKSQYDH